MDRDIAISLVEILTDIKTDIDGILEVLTPADPEEPAEPAEPANDNT